VFDRLGSGVRILRPVPPGVAAMLRDRLDPVEYAGFGMLLPGFPASEIAGALGLSAAQLEARRSALLAKLETFAAASGRHPRVGPLPIYEHAKRLSVADRHDSVREY